MFLDTSHHILDLAELCISLENGERPEVTWLKEKYEHFQKRYHLKNKKETDAILFERMYGHLPQKPSEYLKIRYWRTGQHVPGNRTQCILFGKALELSPGEMQYLLQNYYDRSLYVFDSFSDNCELYIQKYDYMEGIFSNYMQQIPSEQMQKYKISPDEKKHNLRHLYFTDAFNYVYNRSVIHPSVLLKHISSTHYDSEFSRHLKLLGEIPRKTMIRHLIILNMPNLTLDKLNQQLEFLGYLPLKEEHTLVTGEHLDFLLIHLLKKHEKNLSILPARICLDWFQETCRTLDYFFFKEGKPHLRFMHFKALNL